MWLVNCLQPLLIGLRLAGGVYLSHPLADVLQCRRPSSKPPPPPKLEIQRPQKDGSGEALSTRMNKLHVTHLLSACMRMKLVLTFMFLLLGALFV